MRTRKSAIGEYIRAGSAAAKGLQRLLEMTEVYPSSVASSLIPFAFLNKAFQLHTAVLSLCRSGFGSEAYGLSRTMIEMFIALRWITNQNQETRAKEYGFFSEKRKDYLMKTAARYMQPTEEWERAKRKEEARVMKYAARYRSFKFWANLPSSLRGLASEPEQLDGHDLVGNDALWEYEIPYSQASDHVHATVVAVDDFIPKAARPFRVERSRSESLEEDAVFASTIYLFKLVRRVHSARHLDISGGIDRVFQRFAKRHRRLAAF
ncbi:MAG TPA: DUF5677 domain-containing protein [Terriglobia bacterium]|nr:DUF5677 domain-containing protein [Terriglobia bacterium]